jgi:hypothetical protein
VLEICIFIFEFVNTVLVLLTFGNQFVVLGVKRFYLFSELAVLFLQFSDSGRVLVCGLLVGGEVVLELEMGVFGGVVDLGQCGQFPLELLYLLSVVTLLCFCHLSLQ